MNTESNFIKAMLPLNFINPARSKDLFGVQSIGLNSFPESGESQFLRMLSCFMAEDYFPTSVVGGTVIAGGEDKIEGIEELTEFEEFKESVGLTIRNDIFPRLLLNDVRSVHSLQIAGHELEDITINEGKDSVLWEVQGVQFFGGEEEVLAFQSSESDTSEIKPAMMGLTDNQKSSNLEIPETPDSNSSAQLKKEDSVKLNMNQGDIQAHSELLQKEPTFNNISSGGGTTESTPADSSIARAEPYSQISESIISKLEQKGPLEFKMQLEPRELGEINIKLKMVKGKLTIEISAVNSETQTLLASQVDKLIAGMGLRNVQVESIQISQQMLQSQSDQSHSHIMSSYMDSFNRKNQEQQRQRDFFHEEKRDGLLGELQPKDQDNNQVNAIGAHLYNLHRINYTI